MIMVKKLLLSLFWSTKKVMRARVQRLNRSSSKRLGAELVQHLSRASKTSSNKSVELTSTSDMPTPVDPATGWTSFLLSASRLLPRHPPVGDKPSSTSPSLSPPSESSTSLFCLYISFYLFLYHLSFSLYLSIFFPLEVLGPLSPAALHPWLLVLPSRHSYNLYLLVSGCNAVDDLPWIPLYPHLDVFLIGSWMIHYSHLFGCGAARKCIWLHTCVSRQVSRLDWK